MTRTKLKDRILPSYTQREEFFNTASHLMGALLGIAALIMCTSLSIYKGSRLALIGSIVYGISLISLYTVSTVYHALAPRYAKKVMQVIDHCTIYFLIAGTYTPILLCSISEVSVVWAHIIFFVVWGFAIIGAVFTAIDLKKYSVFSMICYIGIGWSILPAAKTAIEAIPMPGLILLLLGGIVYTVGAVIYGLGRKHRYMHSVFHIFVVMGSILQFLCIFFYII